MPKPPILVAPSPNDTIASATWGDPVTDAVNGLVTGRSMVGLISWAAGGSQSIDNTLRDIAIPVPLYDSDGFFSTPNTQLVIPPGLEGIYETLWDVMTGANDANVSYRMHFLVNGVRMHSDNRTCPSTAPAGCHIHAVLPLNAGDIIKCNLSTGAVGEVITTKNIFLRRIADLPAATE